MMLEFFVNETADLLSVMSVLFVFSFISFYFWRIWMQSLLYLATLGLFFHVETESCLIYFWFWLSFVSTLSFISAFLTLILVCYWFSSFFRCGKNVCQVPAQANVDFAWYRLLSSTFLASPGFLSVLSPAVFMEKWFEYFLLCFFVGYFSKFKRQISCFSKRP